MVRVLGNLRYERELNKQSLLEQVYLYIFLVCQISTTFFSGINYEDHTINTYR